MTAALQLMRSKKSVITTASRALTTWRSDPTMISRFTDYYGKTVGKVDLSGKIENFSRLAARIWLHRRNR